MLNVLVFVAFSIMIGVLRYNPTINQGTSVYLKETKSVCQGDIYTAMFIQCYSQKLRHSINVRVQQTNG